MMNRYSLTKQLGDGTYGSVMLATDTDTGETVAIKKLAFLCLWCEMMIQL